MRATGELRLRRVARTSSVTVIPFKSDTGTLSLAVATSTGADADDAGWLQWTTGMWRCQEIGAHVAETG